MTTEGELWHIVEARRDDGTPTMFRIRELAPLLHLRTIFVVELPYPTTEISSRLPDAAAYRRVGELEERWIRPACQALGWEYVASKTEDGSFFLYMYGGTDPQQMIERLSPFDAGLGFYDDQDPDWQEYAGLRELLDRAKAIPSTRSADAVDPELASAIESGPAQAPAAQKRPPATKRAGTKKRAPTKRTGTKKPAPTKRAGTKKPAPTKRAGTKKPGATKRSPTNKPRETRSGRAAAKAARHKPRR